MTETAINWKIKVKISNKEVEVVGMSKEWTQEKFKELEAKYLKKASEEAEKYAER